MEIECLGNRVKLVLHSLQKASCNLIVEIIWKPKLYHYFVISEFPEQGNNFRNWVKVALQVI